MTRVIPIEHPLAQRNLIRLRDKRTGLQEFRCCLGEVSALMAYEATRLLPTRAVSVFTPLTRQNVSSELAMTGKPGVTA